MSYVLTLSADFQATLVTSRKAGGGNGDIVAMEALAQDDE